MSAPTTGPEAHWIYKGFSLLLILFCLELGAFLLVYPWTIHWDVNFLPAMIPALQPVWASDYLRGAVSGLGIVNFWIALSEIFRLRRFAGPDE